MTDTPPPMPPLATLDVSPPRRSLWRNLSLIWLVPVLALVVSLGVAWQTFADRGVLIDITFLNAAGVQPGETQIRFRDVAIGVVEDVSFSSDLSLVIVHARIDKTVASVLAPDTQFWVVRPQVSARGISGLSTVLSGVYIEAAWTPGPNSSIRQFTGIEDEPLVRPGVEGSRVTLRAGSGNLLAAGAPVFYRGIKVGQIETPRLSDTGDAVIVDAFIDAPHDKRITTATRFWDTSGFSVSIGAGGLKLDVGSLSALLSGGIAFDTVFSGGEVVGKEDVFDLFDDEPTARASVFNKATTNAVRFAVLFDGSVNGLSIGAPVQYRGLRVGEVTAINAFIDQTPAQEKVVRLRTTISLDPQAFGLQDSMTESEMISFIGSAVAKGLRARLTSANIFSAALQIELLDVDDASPDTLKQVGDEFPVIPSIASDATDFTANAEGVLKRISNLPVEDVMKQAISLMASIEAIATDEGTRATPQALRGLLDDTRALVTDPETVAVPGELRSAIAELRAVIEDLKTKGAFDSVVSALQKADAAAASISTASDALPALIDDLRTLAAKANGLPAEDLIAAATRVLDSTDALIGTDEAKALPPALTAALEEIRGTLADLRAGGAVENTNATLAATRDAADAVAKAAQGLPELSARLESLVGKAESLIATYGTKSAFNDSTVATLREVRDAARAVAALAKAIERNPNSLLIGR